MPKHRLSHHGFSIILVLVVVSLLATGLFFGYRQFNSVSCDFEWGCPDEELNSESSRLQKKVAQDKNPKLCNKIKGWAGGDYRISKSDAKESCLVYYASVTKDIEVCESIKNSKRKKDCLHLGKP